MNSQSEQQTRTRTGMLSPYRALDLADEKGLMCGKILGDMGADVVKVERPSGDAARNIGPFFHDEPRPENSLFWLGLNTSKRGITLDIEKADGLEILRRLVKTADFVIESFQPGYMDRLGIGYSDLQKTNPGVIFVSITPFGQSGPYRDYKTSDIVAWAVGGEMAPWGEPDRPPFQISHHSQAYFHAGADAAMGTLAALLYRGNTGEGQHVEVSIQESVAQCSDNVIPAWDLWQELRKRGEDARGGNHRATRIWPCKDGYVSWAHGGNSRLTPSMPLVKWMKEEGFADDFMRTFDWDRPNFNDTTQEEMDRIEAPTARFFMAHTKAELLEGAIKRDVMLYPVSTTADLPRNPQLKGRNFWTEVEHPELKTSIVYAGVFGRASEAPLRISRRAPRVGEHNTDIYERELGMTRKELLMLKQAGVI